ncbi:uncharacterized protein LOC131615023 [Vicia villosa]|uniref:uncharacterized protein LOC131615023 n=1 Tax=Vicia villosa TaxID=3911 RepID=UPI00273B56F2|nr:uncharacterized protein LOC131615023 [Vicia villosa]
MLNWKAITTILLELGFPEPFVNWIMIGVSTVSYRFNINGEPSNIMMAKRGIRQGDPIPPYLFVLVMEYMSRLLHKMQLNHNFNHHSRCAKLDITHLAFADDILLLSRGERRSVDMLMQTMSTFYKSTGLVVNPTKWYAYFGAIEEDVKQNILESTGFNEGRVQLVKSVCTTIANYWLQCYPKNLYCLSNFHLDMGESPNNKSTVAWAKMCKPIKHGGLNILNLEVWNQITMLKLLWNLCKKQDYLWVKWMHSYFLKEHNLMIIEGIMLDRGLSIVYSWLVIDGWQRKIVWLNGGLLRMLSVVFAMRMRPWTTSSLFVTG